MPAPLSRPRLERPPWLLRLPAVVVAVGVLVPVAYLVWRAAGADAMTLRDLLRWRHLTLLGNTLLLGLGVLTLTGVLGVGAAWVTTRYRLPGRWALTVLLVAPLAIPGYVYAYCLLGLTGGWGAAYHLTGLTLPRLSGYWGAVVALGLANYPYVMLATRAALQQADPALEETARSLGRGPWGVARQVILPQLLPAVVAGQLLVALHVVSDFGVVSLLGYPTLSYALYQHFAAFDLHGAAWVALLTMTLAGLLVAGEWWATRLLRLERQGRGAGPTRRLARPGAAAWLGFVVAAGLVVAAVMLPLTVLGYWTAQADMSIVQPGLVASMIDSLTAALPAAGLAVALAAPIAFLSRRYPGRRTMLAERLAFVGYATPALAFALGLLATTLALAPWLYQTLGLLVYAYSVHFMAEAIAPLRASLAQGSPRVEEAARSLGAGPFETFRRVTLPRLRPGLAVAGPLVFISVMKELPLTMLLSPTGFQSLATNVWAYASEAMFAEAGPYSLLIVLISCGLVALVLRPEARV